MARAHARDLSALPTLRKALRADAIALAHLAESTFRDTFAADNTAGNMDLHCRRHYGEAIQGAEITDPGRVTLLAEHEEKLVGFAQVRWGIAPACIASANPGEIQRLYVDRDWHGKGVARVLMSASLEAIGSRGSDVAWLGVWERNERAIAFYRKFGFAPVGSHVFPVGTDPQRDIVMALSVAD